MLSGIYNICLLQDFFDAVIELMSKKINNSKANVVWLSLNLLGTSVCCLICYLDAILTNYAIETIVKNCGYKIYRAIGSESFMKDLG